MVNYDKQREFHKLMDNIKKGDVFAWTGDSNPDNAKKGDRYVALVDQPTMLVRENDTGRYIIIRKPTGHLCISTGDFTKGEFLLHGGERVVTNGNKFTLEPPLNVPIKSDGKSSSYYNLVLNARLVKKLKAQLEAGEPLNLETGDIIELMFGNDFDFGNIEKALRRIFEAKHGRGKAGVDIKYDINKCHYFLDQIENKLAN